MKLTSEETEILLEIERIEYRYERTKFNKI